MPTPRLSTTPGMSPAIDTDTGQTPQENQPVVNHRRVGAGDVDRLIATTRALRSRDFSRGGGAVRRAAAEQAGRASAMLTATCANRVRGQLVRAVIGAHQLAGWTAFDAGHNAEARTHHRRALRLARELDDPSLTAYVLYSLSRIDLDNDAPGPALPILRLALMTADAGDDAQLSATLNAHLVRAHAQLDQPGPAVEALNRTRDLFPLEINPGGWAAHFDESELCSTEGALYSYHRGADPEAAISHYLQAMALQRAGHARTGAFMHVTLASLLIRAGELGLGLPMAHAAIDSCVRLTSHRALRRLRRLDTAAADRNTPDLTDLRARITRLGV